MSISPLVNALHFTVHTVFNLYISIVLLRFMLQWVRASFYNPVGQFVIKATNPVLLPLRKIIPGFAKLDWASLVLAFCLQVIEIVLLLAIQGFSVAPTLNGFIGLALWSVGELLDLWLVLFIFTIFAQVLLSWINGGGYNPMADVLEQLTKPLYRPVRRFIPSIGMIDLSPMVIIFGLMLARILITSPIISVGRSLI